MEKPTIEKTIEINAPVANVWSVFKNPAVSHKMGGEYVSDWEVGSSFGWKGRDGNMYTNGAILQIEVNKLLKHTLVELDDASKLLSVITYEFTPNGHATTLSAREELNYEVTADQLEDATDGWDFALNAVKELAEQN